MYRITKISLNTKIIRGSLTSFEALHQVPFPFKNIFALKSGIESATKTFPARSCVISMKGKCEVVGLENSVSLTVPYEGALCRENFKIAAKDAFLLILTDEIDEKTASSLALTPLRVPFEVKRVCFLTKALGSSTREIKARTETTRLFFPIAGSFSLTTDDCTNKKRYVLSSPEEGTILKKCEWGYLNDISEGACVISLESEYENLNDYVQNYAVFQRMNGAK